MPFILTDSFVTAFLLLGFLVVVGGVLIGLELIRARVCLGSWRAALRHFK